MILVEGLKKFQAQTFLTYSQWKYFLSIKEINYN